MKSFFSLNLKELKHREKTHSKTKKKHLCIVDIYYTYNFTISNIFLYIVYITLHKHFRNINSNQSIFTYKKQREFNNKYLCIFFLHFG